MVQSKTSTTSETSRYVRKQRVCLSSVFEDTENFKKLSDNFKKIRSYSRLSRVRKVFIQLNKAGKSGGQESVPT